MRQRSMKDRERARYLQAKGLENENWVTCYSGDQQGRPVHVGELDGRLGRQVRGEI
jgi:hypothetical protein